MKQFNLYTKNNCSQCDTAKATIEAQELLEYVNVINVEEDERAMNLIRSIGIRSMPALSIREGDGEAFTDLYNFIKQIKSTI